MRPFLPPPLADSSRPRLTNKDLHVIADKLMKLAEEHLHPRCKTRGDIWLEHYQMLFWPTKTGNELRLHCRVPQKNDDAHVEITLKELKPAGLIFLQEAEWNIGHKAKDPGNSVYAIQAVLDSNLNWTYHNKSQRNLTIDEDLIPADLVSSLLVGETVSQETLIENIVRVTQNRINSLC